MQQGRINRPHLGILDRSAYMGIWHPDWDCS